MTAIIHVPGVSRVAGAPHISDLPFPRANVRTWISGNGYRLIGASDKIQELIDRNDTEITYPMLSSIGNPSFAEGSHNGVRILRSMVEAYPEEPTGEGYGSPVLALSSTVTFAFLVKWGTAPTPTENRAELFNIRVYGSSQPMISVRLMISGEIRLVVRRLQADAASILNVPYPGALSRYSLIVAEVNYTQNSMTLDVDGVKATSALSTQTGQAPVMPENARFEIGGRGVHPFRGALSDMIWFEGAMDEKAKDKAKSYLTSKLAILNESSN